MAKKLEKQIEIDEKRKRKKPFYPIKIFIFACFFKISFFKISMGTSYRELEKFLNYAFKILQIKMIKINVLLLK